ncbi:uncharacterized protein LOC113147408 [Cyclospora cayetanensis]|uniref:Uncharacterized protein LOC113147408 n=1 Tax=Cyclospora cayetanensis TaxID=88456 RepID=A0A6P6S1X9_9EIME|nr:uncharacterized protein LOC113147408 [Cyclospora cayetanensis]
MEAEITPSCFVFDEPFTSQRLQQLLDSVQNGAELETSEKVPQKESASNSFRQYSVKNMQGFRHLLLVNADLTPKILEQVVNGILSSCLSQRLLSVSLDDNALGEEAAPSVFRLLQQIPNLRVLSLRNTGITDGFLSRIIGFCAQMKKRDESIMVSGSYLAPLPLASSGCSASTSTANGPHTGEVTRRSLSTPKALCITQIDVRNNGLLTPRGALALAAGKCFFSQGLRIFSDLQLPEDSH